MSDSEERRKREEIRRGKRKKSPSVSPPSKRRKDSQSPPTPPELELPRSLTPLTPLTLSGAPVASTSKGRGKGRERMIYLTPPSPGTPGASPVSEWLKQSWEDNPFAGGKGKGKRVGASEHNTYDPIFKPLYQNADGNRMGDLRKATVMLRNRHTNVIKRSENVGKWADFEFKPLVDLFTNKSISEKQFITKFQELMDKGFETLRQISIKETKTPAQAYKYYFELLPLLGLVMYNNKIVEEAKAKFNAQIKIFEQMNELFNYEQDVIELITRNEEREKQGLPPIAQETVPQDIHTLYNSFAKLQILSDRELERLEYQIGKIMVEYYDLYAQLIRGINHSWLNMSAEWINKWVEYESDMMMVLNIIDYFKPYYEAILNESIARNKQR